MFAPDTRTKFSESQQARQASAPFARPPSTRDIQETTHAQMAAPRTQPAAGPDDWTRECLFDCYND